MPAGLSLSASSRPFGLELWLIMRLLVYRRPRCKRGRDLTKGYRGRCGTAAEVPEYRRYEGYTGMGTRVPVLPHGYTSPGTPRLDLGYASVSARCTGLGLGQIGPSRHGEEAGTASDSVLRTSSTSIVWTSSRPRLDSVSTRSRHPTKGTPTKPGGTHMTETRSCND